MVSWNELDGRTDIGNTDKWMNGRMDGWMDGWMDGRMDGWMDGYKNQTFVARKKVYRGELPKIDKFIII